MGKLCIFFIIRGYVWKHNDNFYFTINQLDIRKISESGEEVNVNEASDSNETSKPALTLPKILEIGQVVLFDAICVIDTAASAVSKPNVIGKDAKSKEQEKCSQINTNIAVKKMIYMIATKVTKMDDSKLGGMGSIDKSGNELMIVIEIWKQYREFDRLWSWWNLNKIYL